MRAPAVAVLLLLACGGPSVEDRKQEVTVTRVGDTCGSWQVEPTESPVRTHLTTKCAAGLTCRISAVRIPFEEFTRQFGQCVPPGADQCDATAEDPGCPTSFVCDDPPGRCLIACRTDADCVGEFQFCASSVCRFLTCPIRGDWGYDEKKPDGDCPAGTHCDRGLCLRSAAAAM